MNLNLYDKDLNRISIIGERYKSCLWSEGYNSVETFTLELNATDEYKKKVKEDLYVGRSDRNTLMVIKSVTVKGNTIVASGKTASRVLNDVAFIGTIKENSEIDTAIATAYNNSARYKNLDVVASGLGVKYGHEISNKSFLELCTTMCEDQDVGFKTIRNGSKLETVFYKPQENSNLIFSEKYGNLTITSILKSVESYKNYAIVLGQGEGENRVRVDVDKTNGEERRELIIDVRNVSQEENETLAEYKQRLAAQGNEKLLENQSVFSYEFTPYEKDFGKKYDLGDILTIVLPEYGLTLQARVTQFSQKAQNNSTTTTIKVGNTTIKRR